MVARVCRAGRGIAQGLARDPILAIATVKIATQHPERERVTAGEDMEERFLLNRITLERGTVIGRNKQCAAAIEPHATDPVMSFENQATMAAGVTAHLVVGQPFV